MSRPIPYKTLRQVLSRVDDTDQWRLFRPKLTSTFRLAKEIWNLVALRKSISRDFIRHYGKYEMDTSAKNRLQDIQHDHPDAIAFKGSK